MKILFLSKADCPDYMRDMIYHGLMTHPGISVEELNICDYMHKSFSDRKGGLYGKGFTIFARLDDKTQPQHKITENEMIVKVNDKYYDFIIYGSIHRYSEYLPFISSVYERSRILIVDGEDHPFVEYSFANKGTYFKRENQSNDKEIRPINFAIPKELISNSVPEKTKIKAHIVAGDRSTYIFDKEEDYFADYQTSIWGHTKQKGGWDCCRHYEILMNGCIPYFEGLENCPERTLCKIPKDILLESNRLYKLEGHIPSPRTYIDIIEDLLEHTRTYLTTEALAEYIFA